MVPQLPVKVSVHSITKGWGNCEERRHLSQQRRQGFKSEEAEMPGNGTVECQRGRSNNKREIQRPVKTVLDTVFL